MDNRQSPELHKTEAALLTIPEVCLYLNVKRATFYNLNATGTFGLLPLRLGNCRKVLYSKIELDAYLKASTIQGKFINRQQWQNSRKDYLNETKP
jgi:predicted DNA-binding transcriptional regulator AlpA